MESLTGRSISASKFLAEQREAQDQDGFIYISQDSRQELDHHQGGLHIIYHKRAWTGRATERITRWRQQGSCAQSEVELQAHVLCAAGHQLQGQCVDSQEPWS